MCDTGWVANEFSRAPIKDKRLVNRVIRTGKHFAEYAHASIPQSCGKLADTIGAYRLFDNPKITPEVILMSHRLNTIDRIKKHDAVLLIQDTTHIDFSEHKSATGLGLYSTSQTAKGILLHSTLALTTTGVPLGLLSQKYWTRQPMDPNRNHQELSIKEKESLKWLDTLDESTEGIPSNITSITVCDREADIYDFFNKAVSEDKQLLVRVSSNRLIAGGECKTLVPEVESQPAVGEVITTIPRNSNLNSPEREAKLSIKYCPVVIKPPKNRSDAKSLPNLKLYAVLAEEVSTPPKGIKSIYWLLITTMPVSSVEEAFEKVLWYKERWKIERFHYALKSGCKIEELQLETIDRLQNAIALYSVIAWRLLWLTYETRENPDTPCDTILQKHEWQSLYCFVNKTKDLPDKAPTMKETIILIARLGGFLARKGDGNPGVTVLWRGMSRLTDISQAWLIFTSLTPSSNVYNA